MTPREETLAFLLSRLNLIRESLPFARRVPGRHGPSRSTGEAAACASAPCRIFSSGRTPLVRSHRLLTRDGARYRSYFPDLDIISPETHP